MQRWTQQELDWLRENYHSGTINDTIKALEYEFGRTRSRQAVFMQANKMGLRKDTHGTDRNRRAEKTMRWTDKRFEREYAWMLENDTTESVAPTIEKFHAEFGIRLTRSQVSLFRSTHGNRKRKAHGGGAPNKPVGSTKMGKDGYVMVKVREWPDKPCTKDNWRFLHHLVWEEANGCQVPDDHVIMFADHDRRNVSPENLVAVPRRLVGVLNNSASPSWTNRETLLACIMAAELKMAVVDAEQRKPRTCGVCGAEFVTEKRNWRHPPQTCPDCLAAGLKARGDRGDKQVVTCLVCGEMFARTSKSAKRCPECCRARPHQHWKQHKRYYELHGTR